MKQGDIICYHSAACLQPMAHGKSARGIQHPSESTGTAHHLPPPKRKASAAARPSPWHSRRGPRWRSGSGNRWEAIAIFQPNPRQHLLRPTKNSPPQLICWLRRHLILFTKFNLCWCLHLPAAPGLAGKTRLSTIRQSCCPWFDHMPQRWRVWQKLRHAWWLRLSKELTIWNPRHAVENHF